jgi:hypothetical protein
MESGFIVYLEQLKRKQKRAQKQEVVAVCQTVEEGRTQNRVGLVQVN